MRPLRFLLLLTAFVVVPIILTCWSLFTAGEELPTSFQTGYGTKPGGIRAWFSFSTPSSLFPPSAVISLRSDNSTFFLARPAAFGPALPSRGLSGRLWVGKGFGDDALFKDEDIQTAGWELGCSDVPGWGEEDLRRLPVGGSKIVGTKKVDGQKTNKPASQKRGSGNREEKQATPIEEEQDDGTDDHLHRPLPDSNPATPAKPGEPANAVPPSKERPPTHADIESLQESADIAGKVVMLARGGCGFLEKVKWAQRRGGIAVIVGDNQRNVQLTVMYAKGDISNVTIPAVFTSYTSARILSSLVPPELLDESNVDVAQGKATKEAKSSPAKGKSVKGESNAAFTSTSKTSPTSVAQSVVDEDSQNGWFRNALSAVGIGSNSPNSHAEDSRRPPSSGNIDWVLVEDWEEEDEEIAKLRSGDQIVVKGSGTSTTSSTPKAITAPASGDNFVIGVQDWRDVDLLAPIPSQTTDDKAAKPKNGKQKNVESTVAASGSRPTETTLKGGSITPGSGEYDHSKSTDKQHKEGSGPSTMKSGDSSTSGKKPSFFAWLSIFGSHSSPDQPEHGSNPSGKGAKVDSTERTKPGESQVRAQNDDDEDLPGLWIIMTPTSVSTSPFLDTLLVLVVSPLVTLTFVYGLLLLRSRIRRRRWRAPKSVVERLPVRTYHTMTTASSTTSSQVHSPDSSPQSLPLLSTPRQDISRRSRPRSQTTPGLTTGTSSDDHHFSSSPSRSPAPEKHRKKNIRPRKYTGRQVECVVCLEEYVDGESQVMSLPCGHEFHAECITPWLVTRRRTCPICKGDVVRNLARSNSNGLSDGDSQGVGPDELTGDDVQERAAETVNNEPTAAIPIPTREPDDIDENDEDIELGRDTEPPFEDPRQGQSSGSGWRNVVNASISRLSGDTVWKQNSQPTVDRSR